MLDRRAFLGVSLLGASALAARAQSWPTRPVRLVVPYAPGGTTDAVARITAEALSRVWGQNVFIENRAGQGTNIGAEFVARAEPDGYTLLVATASTAVGRALYRGLKYDFLSDLAPVSFLVTFPLLFYVPAASPAKTIGDVIALAREAPGGIFLRDTPRRQGRSSIWTGSERADQAHRQHPDDSRAVSGRRARHGRHDRGAARPADRFHGATRSGALGPRPRDRHIDRRAPRNRAGDPAGGRDRPSGIRCARMVRPDGAGKDAARPREKD